MAVLSYACWRKRFGADASVIGRIVKFNGMDFTVLGVAPQGFIGTELYFAPDVFFPMMMQKQLEGFRDIWKSATTATLSSWGVSNPVYPVRRPKPA